MYDSRDDVPDQYRFALDRIFPDRDAWATECDAIASDIDAFDTDQPLADLLAEFESLSARDHRVVTYASLRADVATDDDQRAADRDRATSIHADLLAVRDDVERRLRDTDADVPARFERYAADARRRGQYALDPAAAALLTQLDDVLDAPARVHRALVDRDFDPPTIDADGESVTLSRSERGRILREGERSVRRRAFEAVRDEYRDREATLAANLDAMARENVRVAGARGHDSALEAALSGDDASVACRPESHLPRDAYDALVGGVRENLAPKHRLERVRRDALGVDTLQPWDRNAVPSDGEAPRYDFDDATDVIRDALAPLGDEYLSRLDAIFAEQRIDAFDYPGKTEAGAGYATAAAGRGPFVLARWNGSLSHLFLLAHELGHAVHFSFSEDAQPHVTSGIPRSAGELPSKLNEALLATHLLETTSGDERAAVAARAVRSIGSNLFYSARWSAFTHRLHERIAAGARLTADWLADTYGDLFAAFNPVVERTDRLDAGWTTGMYHVPLYHHYPYILGTAGALSVVDGLDDGSITPADYADFLRAGTSTPAVEAVEDLGVDATSEAAVAQAVARFDDYVDAFAEATE